jgi:hypothetical protein
MLNKHTILTLWFTLALITLLALVPTLFATASPVAEAAPVKERSARAGWTTCSGTTCTDTVIIGTIQGSGKTLSFEEVTYRKSTGTVISRREAFARNVNFKQDGLKSASVAARIAVKQCDSRDVCKKAGSVHVKATWTGKGKTRKDPEDGTRFREATVTATVAGKALGTVNFANLSELPK